jgi:hypothetical protein
MEAVSEVVRLSFQKMKQNYPEKLLTAAVFPATPNYANSSKEYHPEWFTAWKKTNSKNPYVSGGNFVPEGFKYQQDAMGRLMGRFIDAIIPMEYTMDDVR